LRGIRAYDELQIAVTEVAQVKQTVTAEEKFGAMYVGLRSGSSFRDRNKHQSTHRDSADGGRHAKATR